MTEMPAGERNVLGGPLEECGTDPMTGFFRDGNCSCGPGEAATHTVCVVATKEFLDHQRHTGNDLTTPVPGYGFPGLVPGDRWCVVAVRWMHAYLEGAAAPVVLASTNVKCLDVIPLKALQELAVDVPEDISSLG